MKSRGNARVCVTAKVLVTLEVDVGHWGGDCDTQQVFDQASEGAVNILRQVFTRASGEAIGIRIDPCYPDRLGRNVRLVGNPKVTAVLVRKKE